MWTVAAVRRDCYVLIVFVTVLDMALLDELYGTDNACSCIQLYRNSNDLIMPLITA